MYWFSSMYLKPKICWFLKIWQWIIFPFLIFFLRTLFEKAANLGANLTCFIEIWSYWILAYTLTLWWWICKSCPQFEWASRKWKTWPTFRMTGFTPVLRISNYGTKIWSLCLVEWMVVHGRKKVVGFLNLEKTLTQFNQLKICAIDQSKTWQYIGLLLFIGKFPY